MIYDIRLEPVISSNLRKTDVEESLARDGKHNYDQDKREGFDTLSRCCGREKRQIVGEEHSCLPTNTRLYPINPIFNQALYITINLS